MKQLIIPAVIAILAGVGGGSGYAYMRASKQYVADSTQMADSLKANPPHDSTAHDSTSHETSAEHGDSAGAESAAEHEPLTPADSIRALEKVRTSLRAETKGLTDATPPLKGGGEVHAASSAGSHAPAPAAGAPPPKPAGTKVVAEAIQAAKRDAMETVLPEPRLAKIFGAMKAVDAAKVMDQMNDTDVRSILNMMTDKQAAAILTSLPAARAAAISKGTAKAAGAKP